MSIGTFATGALIAAVGGCAHASLAHATAPCGNATPLTARTITFLQALVTATDSSEVAFRQSVGLVATSPSSVSLVSQTKTCNSAVSALNAAWNTPGLARTANVYKIGSFYAVEEVAPPPATGDYRVLIVYTSKWVRVGGMSIP